jgi:hypothetical protein
MMRARRPHKQTHGRHTPLRLETLETREFLSANATDGTLSMASPAPVTQSFQDSAAYTGTQDAKIIRTYPTLADLGGSTILRSDGRTDQAALIKWDLSSIAAGNTIQSASLSLMVTDPSRDTYEIYALKRPWKEGAVTWQGNGLGSNWQVAGASGSLDRESTSLGTLTVSNTGVATINLNAAGIAKVQSWINDPSSNYGFIIQDYGNSDGLSFTSSEIGTLAYRPKLTVTYTSSGSTTPPDDPNEPPPAGTTNQAPQVEAGANQSTTVSGTINLNGTVTDDGLPNPPAQVTTTWTKVSGPGTVTFGNATAKSTTARFGTAGTYVLQLLASDGTLKTSDTLTVTVTSDTPQGVQGFFVSPNGSASGDGSAARPWDLQTALSQPAAVKPGATIWLREGTYRGAFTSRLTGTAAAPITVAAYPGEHVVIDTYKPGTTGNPMFKVNGSYTNFVGFEMMSSDPSSRITALSGSDPADIRRGSLQDYGNYNKFINLVLHDMDMGIGMWSQGTGGEVYGSIIYNNGWIGPDRPHGHGIYAQNQYGTKRIADNIIFNQFDYGFHAYGTSKAYLNNFLLEGNTIFNSGGAKGVGYQRQPDILIGGGASAQNITLRGNRTYQNGFNGVVYLGDTAVNKNLTLQDNYFVSDLALRGGWTSVNATGNTIVGKSQRILELDVPTGTSPSSYSWNNNHYTSTGATRPFNYEGASKTWSQWKAATGLDSNSDFSSSLPTGADVFVERNEYEAGRANITVYNWNRSPAVSIDLSSVLTVGATYEIHNVMDLFGTPVLSGVYDGKPINLPIKATAAPRPIGYTSSTPVGTGTDFGAFVVTSTSMATAAAALPAPNSATAGATIAADSTTTTTTLASSATLTLSSDVQQQWSSEATEFQQLESALSTAAAGSSSHAVTGQKLSSTTSTTDSRSADSGLASRIRGVLDRLYDRIDTPAERQVIADQIESHFAEVKATVFQAIDAAIVDLQDNTTDLKADLQGLFDKLDDLRPLLARPV